jgi:hypothetical protein
VSLAILFIDNSNDVPFVSKLFRTIVSLLLPQHTGALDLRFRACISVLVSALEKGPVGGSSLRPGEKRSHTPQPCCVRSLTSISYTVTAENDLSDISTKTCKNEGCSRRCTIRDHEA